MVVNNPDYGISAVKYDANHNYITHLRIHPINGTRVGAYGVWARNQVVSQIEHHYSFVTIRAGRNQWIIGADVHVVSVNGAKYLRTDSNSTAADNLENLPEF